MNKVIYLIMILAMGNVYAAHEHAHSNIKPTTECISVSYSQKCAKTMSNDFDANGRLWSVWSNGEFLYVSFSSDKGNSFSNGVRVNQYPEKIAAGREHRPKIKLSRRGIIYISWTQKLEKRFTGNIRFSQSVDGGKTFSMPITVNDNLDIISHRFDTLGVNRKGDVYISWLDKRDFQLAQQNDKDYRGAAVYFAVLNKFGFSKNIKLADNSCECCRMAMDFDMNNLPVIAWRHIFPGNIRDHRIVNFNAKWVANTPNRLSEDNWKIDGCPHQGPSVSVSKDNTYHAVWFNNAKDRHGIFYAKSHNAGTTFGAGVSIGHYDRNANHADVLSVGHKVYILWQEFNGSKYQLFSQVSGDNGNSWGSAILIASSSRASDSPFLLNNDDTVYAAWHIPTEKFKLRTIEE